MAKLMVMMVCGRAACVFDDRMTVDFSDHAKTIGECTHCGGPTNNFENCAEASCNELVLICLNYRQNKDLLYHR